MKLVNIITLLIFLVPVFQCTSCKKYLDEKSDKSLVVPNSVNDLQAILDDNYIMNSFTPGFGETSADDYFILSSDYNSLGDFDQRAYTWRLTTYNFPNDWGYAYNAIYNANFCLDQLNDITITPQNQSGWNNVKGSALFFRGYYFLDLCWEYAKAYDETSSSTDKGVVLRLGSDFNAPSVRATVQQSYNQVVKDLAEAASYLPQTSTQSMRPSRVACYGALARAYLSMRKYDSAFKYSDLALGLKSDLLDYNSSDVSILSDVPFQPFNKEIIFYTTQSGNYSAKAAPLALIDTVIFSSYDSNDLRKAALFYPNNGYQSFKGSYSSASYPLFSGIATDELYLIRAESSARLGKISDAMTDLNVLLVKRWATGSFTPLTAANQTEAINIILKERRKELTMRGLRWIDIKRMNKDGAGIVLQRIVDDQTYTLPPNDNKYALPIPSDIIIETGISQN